MMFPRSCHGNFAGESPGLCKMAITAVSAKTAAPGSKCEMWYCVLTRRRYKFRSLMALFGNPPWVVRYGSAAI